MNNQDEEHNMGSTLWQSQSLDAPRISLEFVRYQAEKLNSDFRKESYGVYAGVIVSVLGLWWVWSVFPLEAYHQLTWVMRLGMSFLIPAVVYGAIKIRSSGEKLSIADGEQIYQSLHAYRIELQRRRVLYFWMSRWVMLSTVPGVLVIIVGGIVFDPRPGKAMRYGMSALIATVGFLLNHWFYRCKARKFQRELDALTTMDTK